MNNIYTMAKVTSKPTIRAEKKVTAHRKKATESSNDLIEKACVLSLAKLSELDIGYHLQSEINWCLGSYRNDHNPIGLYQMAERSLHVFKGELAKKTKGITAKLIGEIEKAIKRR